MNDLWNQPNQIMFAPQPPQAIAPPVASTIIAAPPTSVPVERHQHHHEIVEDMVPNSRIVYI